ncbi:helix-turn-helix domain-containing protein [Streptomyces sp. NPDC001941]|uniref:helix-turn-helix domain-containing protein n=1 Tax=Streptomyces sp. NPDC001941 TaxID=3154659 RepID=UPI00331A1074
MAHENGGNGLGDRKRTDHGRTDHEQTGHEQTGHGRTDRGRTRPTQPPDDRTASRGPTVHSVFRSDVAPPADRYELCRTVVAEGAAPTRFLAEATHDFPVVASRTGMGSSHLVAMDFPRVRMVRTGALIRRSDPELFQIAYVRGGELRVSQGDNDAVVRRGQLAFWSTSRPFDTECVPEGPDRSSRVLMLHVPMAGLPLSAAGTDRLVARAIPADEGLPAVLRTVLRGISAQAPTLTESEATRLGRVVTDLAGAFLTDGPDARRPEAPTAVRRRALLASIDGFIDGNLADQDLTPGVIAGHHHISLRTLHNLFEGRERGVAATVRQRRLERCRADLVAYPEATVQSVAARWGFPDPAAFSRAFRSAYGTTATDFRRAAAEERRRAPALRGISRG